MITKEIYINTLSAIPELNGNQNVISRVTWEIVFSDGEFSSKGQGVTLLNTQNIENFTPAEQLTESQVALWVEAELSRTGQLAELEQYHTYAIEVRRAESAMVVWPGTLQQQKTRPVETYLTARI